MSMNKLIIEFIWIPQNLGGHNSAPYDGMRTTIRWQRYIEEYLHNTQDTEWSKIVYRSDTLQGKAVCRINTPDLTPHKKDPVGELVEFLSGFRVIAVGRVEEVLK